MGRQINFFMFGDDEYKFLNYVKETQNYLIDRFGNPISFEGRQPSSCGKEEIQINRMMVIYYIAAPNSKIEIRNRVGLLPAISEVIEFSPSVIRNNNELWNGRIWIETKYYDENRNIVTKPKWFIDMFNLYQKWIRKNLHPNKDKDFYVGDMAYKLKKEKGYRLMNSPKVEIDFTVI
jgi:hypothetical protein